MEDLTTFKEKIVSVIAWFGNIFTWFKFKKPSEIIEEAVDTVTNNRVTFFQRLTFKIFPKARLTYWLADEEVVIYVDKFHQKDKFKLAFREIISGKIVLVNSANPINYRLEELGPNDKITETVIQQDQRYT